MHAEIGGGRLAEFHALKALRTRFARLPLTATIHDPERLVWRRERLPWPLSLASKLPSPLPQVATVLADPLCLHEERQLARSLTRLITLTQSGSHCLRQRMGLRGEQMAVIPHGNLTIAPAPLPPLEPLKLLYFGFIYRGKGIEDLLDALAMTFTQHPTLRGQLRLTLAGGSEPEMAFGPAGSYLDQLRQHIQRLGLQDSIDWQLDLPAADIPLVIQAHHVMVLPYRESSKLKLLGQLRGTSGALSWAAACGRGVITSDARSFAEEVAHGNGVIFPQGNVSALAAEISHLCATPERAIRWAEHASMIGNQRVWSQTTTEIYTLSLHDVLPISHSYRCSSRRVEGMNMWRKPLVWIPLLAVLAGVISALQWRTTDAQPTSQTLLKAPRAIEWKDFLGVNVQFQYFEPDIYQKQMSRLDELGLNWVRLTIHWPMIEPQQGVYDVTTLDAAMQQMQAHRYNVIAYLVGSPAFASSAPQGATGIDQYPPKDFDLFANRMATLAERYPQVNTWQVWNEPNIIWLPKEDPVAYYRLLTTTAQAIRAKVPNKPVATAGRSSDLAGLLQPDAQHPGADARQTGEPGPGQPEPDRRLSSLFRAARRRQRQGPRLPRQGQ